MNWLSHRVLSRLMFAAGVGLTVALFVVGFGGCPGEAPACPPSYGYYNNYYPTYYEHRVVYDVTPIYVATFIPVPVATVGASLPPQATAAAPAPPPAPAAAATPTVAAAAPSPCEEQLRQLRAEFAELKALVRTPPAMPQVEAAPSPKGAELSILASRCAVCHGKDAPTRAVTEKGKVKQFFADDGRLLDTAKPAKMIAAVHDQEMPPPANDPYWAKHPDVPRVQPLNDEEYGRLVRELGGK